MPIKNINFTISAGEFVGLIGVNGAGKTTLIKLMTGLLYPDEGSDITILGSNPYKKNKEFLKSISYISTQKNQLLWDLTAMESFELSRRIYEVPYERYKQTLLFLSDLLECGKLLNQPIRQMSFGEKMKLELILSLLHSPKLLFLDEPTIGLDYITQNKIRSFLKAYSDKFAATIILTSHNIDDINKLCTRLLCLKEQTIYYDGSLDNFIKMSAYKKLEIVFEVPINEEIFNINNSYVLFFNEYKAVLRIPQGELAPIMRKLSSFNIKDMQITEDDLDNVFSKLFTPVENSEKE